MDINIYHHFPAGHGQGDHFPGCDDRTLGLLRMLIHQGEKIMATQAEASAKLDTILTNLAGVKQNVVDLNVDVQAVDTKIQELIAAATANGDVPPEIMAKIDALGTDSADLVTGTQAVEDKLTSLATPPAQG